MVFDRTSIIENFRGLIGFMPSHDSSNSAAKVDDSLKQSFSGQYINQLHPYFTAEIFSSTSDLFKEFTVGQWQANRDYLEGDVVAKGANYYVATDASVNEDPATASDSWRKTTLLSQWIQSKYDGAVLHVVDALNEANRLDGHGKSLRGATPLFDGNGYSSSRIVKVPGRFVGYRVTPSQQNVSVTLQRIGMQLDRPMNVPIYVRYNGGEVLLNNLSFQGNGRFSYVDIPPSSFFNGMGDAVIGYYEDDLGEASAISMNSSDLDREPCYGCGNGNLGYRGAWGKWIGVAPISISGETETADYNTNYGLNLTFSFRCDLSDVIIREKMSLVPALKAQLKVTFMEALAYNVRNNKNADQTSILAYNQLDNYQDPFNPRNELKRAIKSLQFEMSGVNPACLPCNSRVKVRNRII